jgi:hypothetical protein
MDIFQMVSDNLRHIKAGELKPSVVSEHSAGLHSFFAGHGISYPATVPLPEGFDSYGAILTYHENIPMAHIICRAGNDVVYMVEILERDMRMDADLCVGAEARKQIHGGRCYADTGIGGKQVIVWKERETICAAASTMDPAALIGKLRVRNAESGM